MSAEHVPTSIELGIPNVRKTIKGEQKEFCEPSHVQVLLIGMQGEGGFSLHDPLSLGVISRRVQVQHPQVAVKEIDTQPELHGVGKIDTDNLAHQLYDTVMEQDDSAKATVVGISMPIFSLNYTRVLLKKYEQLCEEKKPQGRVELILGGSIPSHTDESLLRDVFPDSTFVKGEGEERFSQIVEEVKQGKEVTRSTKFEYADLQDYVGSTRDMTKETIIRGGKPKTEFSRGCGFGSCTFCSRPDVIGRNGRDYRTVPPEMAIKEVRAIEGLFEEVSDMIDADSKEEPIHARFEITDEDAFSNIEATRGLVSALKSAQLDGEAPLRRIPFSASMRVDSLLALAEEKDAKEEVSLLDQLVEVGLDQVFLGVEGGTDRFLQQFAKGQKMENVAKAVKTVQQTKWEDTRTGEEQQLKLEMGFIAFSYRQDYSMLQDNVRFLSKIAGDPDERVSDDIEQTNAKYVSSLFNVLDIRAGTNDAVLLRRYIGIANDPKHPDADKYKEFKGYDPEKNFNINTSAYENVPFIDPKVGEVYAAVEKFAREDEFLYYTLKSAQRAGALSQEQQTTIHSFYTKMKGLHLKFLRNAVGLDQEPDVRNKRKELVERMQREFGSSMKKNSLDSLRREINVFLYEDEERNQTQGSEQHGALLVMTDAKERILLVRPRGQNEWAFPGGNINITPSGESESPDVAAVREAREELGIPEGEQIQIIRDLPRYYIQGHQDKTTGERKSLTLLHLEAKAPKVIDIRKADHEIADTLYLSLGDIMTQKFPTKANVKEIAAYMSERKGKSDGSVIDVFTK